jgi:hypothetical protein
MPITVKSGRNGSFPTNRSEVAGRLTGDPLTEGYRPTLPYWAYFTADMMPQYYLMRDVELMLIHPVVRSALEYFKSGIAGAEFWGGPNPDDPDDHKGLPISLDSRVSRFVIEQCFRFWDRGVPGLQGGYEYGWIGGENLYVQDESSGQLYWDGLLQFSPRDVYLLTVNSHPVGIRVKQVANRPQDMPTDTQAAGMADLWLSSRDVPAKGLWYAHNPRYSRYFGQSQLLGAWRPWRRLAWKDGAEANVDLGFYRHWCRGPIIRYPEEDIQPGANAPGVATTLDSQGRPRRYARDMARQIAEWYKSGAGIGLPSTKYPNEMGSGDKWGAEFPESTLNVTGGIGYIRHLWDQIRYGVGVAPELMEASESGGGFNGRMVPLYAFLEQQQHIADALLLLFVQQVLIPLVRWNFGNVPWQVQVKPLLITRLQGQKGEASQPSKPAAPGAGPRGGERGLPRPAGLPEPPQLGNGGGWSLEAQQRWQAEREALARELAKKLLRAA